MKTWQVTEIEVATDQSEGLWKVKINTSDVGVLEGDSFIPGTEREWTKIMNEMRAEKVKEACLAKEIDPIAAMIKIWFKNAAENRDENMRSLEIQVFLEFLFLRLFLKLILMIKDVV